MASRFVSLWKLAKTVSRATPAHPGQRTSFMHARCERDLCNCKTQNIMFLLLSKHWPLVISGVLCTSCNWEWWMTDFTPASVYEEEAVQSAVHLQQPWHYRTRNRHSDSWTLRIVVEEAEEVEYWAEIVLAERVAREINTWSGEFGLMPHKCAWG